MRKAKAACKTPPHIVKSKKDGTVSSVISLQPVKKPIPSWKKLMSNWHLDKRVPVSLIVALFVQTMSVVWWASTVEARVTEQDKKGILTAEYILRQQENDKKTIEILARLDERVKQQTEIVASIERKMTK